MLFPVHRMLIQANEHSQTAPALGRSFLPWSNSSPCRSNCLRSFSFVLIESSKRCLKLRISWICSISRSTGRTVFIYSLKPLAKSIISRLCSDLEIPMALAVLRQSATGDSFLAQTQFCNDSLQPSTREILYITWKNYNPYNFNANSHAALYSSKYQIFILNLPYGETNRSLWSLPELPKSWLNYLYYESRYFQD